MVEIICEIDPSYYKNVTWSKDCKKFFLYCRLIKAVYDTLLEAIIFCKKLFKHLTDNESVQNKYDMCTFNKIVNFEQITVQFHVDDLKVSHKEQAVLEEFYKDLRDELFHNYCKLRELYYIVV